MTPSKAILLGSGIIALSIVAAAFVLPERGLLADKEASKVSEANTQIVTAPRFQIIKTEHGRTWRLNTETGEITVCRLQADRMICANSTMATEMPKATPKQLESERQQERLARRDEGKEMLDRFMGFFERIIKFAQKHAGGDKPPPPEDERFKQL